MCPLFTKLDRFSSAAVLPRSVSRKLGLDKPFIPSPFLHGFVYACFESWWEMTSRFQMILNFGPPSAIHDLTFNFPRPNRDRD